MKLIKPSVKHINFSDNIQQIGFAAAVCYNSNKQGTVAWLEELWKNGHKSVFRHGTNYYIIPIYSINEKLIGELKGCSLIDTYENEQHKLLYVSANWQYVKEHSYIDKYFGIYKTSECSFIASAKQNNCFDEVINLLRETFLIVTQISTSRELNRVSPNNICEQSTRYCNFNKDKYEGHISFCEPHWLDATTYYKNDNTEEKADERIFIKDNNTPFALVGSAYLDILKLYPIATKGIPQKDFSSLCYSPHIAIEYIKNCLDAEERYFQCIKEGMRPEDARGLLPLDVATKCVYTYSIKQWKHIIDLRYNSITGTPHPNAKYVIGKVRTEIEDIINHLK